MATQTESHWLRAQAAVTLHSTSLLMPLMLRAQCPLSLAAEEANQRNKLWSGASISLPRPHEGKPSCNGQVVLPKARRLRGLRAWWLLASRTTHHVVVGDMQAGSCTLQKVVEGSVSIIHCQVVVRQRHKHQFHNGFTFTGAHVIVLLVGLAGQPGALITHCQNLPCSSGGLNTFGSTGTGQGKQLLLFSSPQPTEEHNHGH
nr:uncharacterized protein LOC110361186 [Columba livia]